MAAPVDPPVLSLKLRGHTACYSDGGGDGPVLVLVHGAPGSVRDFRWLEGPLVERIPAARVVRVELPGFGGTASALGGDMSVEDRGRFLADFIEALALPDAVVVAHSVGGPPAIDAAARCPERVSALVLLASVGMTPHRLYRRLPYPRVLAPPLAARWSRRLVAPILRRAFVSAGFSARTPTHELFTALRVLGALRFDAIADRVRALGTTSVHIRLLTALDDPLVEPAIAVELGRAFGVEPTFFETGGHNIQKTRADEVAEVVAGALEGLLRRG